MDNSGNTITSMDTSDGSANTLATDEALLDLDTVLRQWIEMRPEQPPIQIRPWLFIGSAHHACAW